MSEQSARQERIDREAEHTAFREAMQERSEPAAASVPLPASGGTQEFTAAEVNEEIYALGGDRRHRQIRMLHQLARLLSPSPALTHEALVARQALTAYVHLHGNAEDCDDCGDLAEVDDGRGARPCAIHSYEGPAKTLADLAFGPATDENTDKPWNGKIYALDHAAPTGAEGRKECLRHDPPIQGCDDCAAEQEQAQR
jgi:hypothetical protein